MEAHIVCVAQERNTERPGMANGTASEQPHILVSTGCNLLLEPVLESSPERCGTCGEEMPAQAAARRPFTTWELFRQRCPTPPRACSPCPGWRCGVGSAPTAPPPGGAQLRTALHPAAGEQQGQGVWWRVGWGPRAQRGFKAAGMSGLCTACGLRARCGCRSSLSTRNDAAQRTRRPAQTCTHTDLHRGTHSRQRRHAAQATLLAVLQEALEASQAVLHGITSNNTLVGYTESWSAPSGGAAATPDRPRADHLGAGPCAGCQA